MLYADKTIADAYHAARLTGTAWAALSDPIKEAALQSAGDSLDAYAVSRGGWVESYTPETIPTDIKNACCLEALELTRPETESRKRAQQQGVKAISIGGASESYTDAHGFPVAIINSPQALALLRRYTKQTGSGVSIR
jgi:hypothetical protein